jgi:hypothetical protein
VVVSVGEVQEQMLNIQQHFFWSGIAAINFVDNEHHRQVGVQRFRQHIPSLWQWAFGSVYQQQYAVNKCQRAFYFATEVGVARGIDQIDLDAPPFDGGSFGQNGDTAFTLLVVGIHDPLHQVLVRSKSSGLTQQFIHQGGFAMVDVRDNRDVSK